MVQDNATSEFASQEQQIQDFEAPPAPVAEPRRNSRRKTPGWNSSWPLPDGKERRNEGETEKEEDSHR